MDDGFRCPYVPNPIASETGSPFTQNPYLVTIPLRYRPSATRRQRISSLSSVLGDRTVFSFVVTRTAVSITIAIATERNKLRRCLREWRKMHLRSLPSVIRNSGINLCSEMTSIHHCEMRVTQIFIVFVAFTSKCRDL